MEDPTPFFKRKRNLVTALVFLEQFIFPSFSQPTLFLISTNPISVLSSFALGYQASQFFGGILAKIIGAYEVRTSI